MHKDPVCGKRINRGKAHAIVEYEGVAYFLCCPMCQTQFEETPKTFARPELGEKIKKVNRKTYATRPRSVA